MKFNWMRSAIALILLGMNSLLAAQDGGSATAMDTATADDPVAVENVQAEDKGNVGLGFKLGTLGYGLELDVPLSRMFHGRLGYNGLSYSTDDTYGDISYDTGLDLSTATALLDWYPFAGNFRMTLGYVGNGNEIDAASNFQVNDDVTIGDTTYTVTSAADQLSGKVTVSDGPYLGLGWGNASKKKGFGYTFDIGVLYQGTPDVELTGHGQFSAPAVAGELEKEEHQFEDDISDYKIYPVVSAGVTYTF